MDSQAEKSRDEERKGEGRGGEGRRGKRKEERGKGREGLGRESTERTGGVFPTKQDVLISIIPYSIRRYLYRVVYASRGRRSDDESEEHYHDYLQKLGEFGRISSPSSLLPPPSILHPPSSILHPPLCPPNPGSQLSESDNLPVRRGDTGAR
jgi:hypothetical protein